MELALAVLICTSLTCVGLLALWAATSPWHWFLRTAIFVGMLSLRDLFSEIIEEQADTIDQLQHYIRGEV